MVRVSQTIYDSDSWDTNRCVWRLIMLCSHPLGEQTTVPAFPSSRQLNLILCDALSFYGKNRLLRHKASTQSQLTHRCFDRGFQLAKTERWWLFFVQLCVLRVSVVKKIMAKPITTSKHANKQFIQPETIIPIVIGIKLQTTFFPSPVFPTSLPNFKLPFLLSGFLHFTGIQFTIGKRNRSKHNPYCRK